MKKKRVPSGDRGVRVEGGRADALALAIASNDWERAALLLSLGLSLAARSLPDETIDDVLALVSGEEAR